MTLVPLAITVGALTGLGAVGFRWLITTFTRMFTGYDDFSALGRIPSAHWPGVGFWFLLRARDIAVDGPDPVDIDEELENAAAALAASSSPMVPVVGADGRYAGCLSARDLTDALNEPDPPRTVRPLVEQPVLVSGDSTTTDILTALTGYGGTGLPVLDTDRGVVIGWITYEAVLTKLHPGIADNAEATHARGSLRRKGSQ